MLVDLVASHFPEYLASNSFHLLHSDHSGLSYHRLGPDLLLSPST